MAATRRAGPGAEMVAARERLGLSPTEAATRTRIPLRYLEALERGDTSVFPPGPFLGGYTRQYRTFLKLPDTPVALPPVEEATVTEPSRPGRKSRRQAVRLAFIGGLAALSLLLLAGISRELVQPGEAPVGQPPDQVVRLKVPEPVRARVVADGRLLFSGPLRAGESQTFGAHDRLEIDLDTLDDVAIDYNGRTLEPLGVTSRKRRLVFIDDVEP